MIPSARYLAGVRGRTVRHRVVVLGVVAVLTVCTTGTREDGEIGDPKAPRRGGTLKAAMLIEPPAGLDPQLENYNVTFELFRCCLLRTLLTYRGVEGEPGLELRPDLATAMPTTDDGIGWTFELRDDVRYAPPFDDLAVSSADIVRAIERLLTVGGGVATDLLVIDGAQAFLEGEANRIAGLSTPDVTTLVVRLTRPFSLLPYLFAYPATAPIPPGAADGHEKDYGRFLVATGPYMVEGAEGETGAPPEERGPSPGFEPGRSLVLVRNPSWKSASDPLRSAYVDRIEISFGGTEADLARKVEQGSLDLVLDLNAPPEAVARFAEDEGLVDRLFMHPAEAIIFASLNVGTAPFDDIHVRRAVYLVVDRAALLRVSGGASAGEPAFHMVPDSLVGGSLSGDLPEGAGPSSALDAARAELARSPYDRDGDGRCDAAACNDVFTISPDDELSVSRAELVAGALAELGIELRLRTFDFGAVFTKASTPPERVPLTIGMGWLGSYPHPSAYLRPMLHSSGLADTYGTNLALVGASADQLRGWGYELTTVPSLDERIDACLGAGTECWADVARDATDLAAYVPLYWHATRIIVSDRVTAYAFDQALVVPALDRIAVR